MLILTFYDIIMIKITDRWLNIVDTVKVESFLKIVEVGSISKAAELLYVSQSTLSGRLSSLEKDLNVMLVKRGQGIKGIQLTQKGLEFLELAINYLQLQRKIEAWSQQEDLTEVRVSIPHSLNTYFLNSFYYRMANERILPLNITSHWNHTIYERLHTHEIEMAIVSRPYNTTNLQTYQLFSEPLVIVYREGVADYSTIKNIKRLPRQQQIEFDWGPDFHIWANEHWPMEELPAITVDSVDLLLQLLNMPQSWAVIPLCIYRQMKDSMQLKRIDVVDPIYRALYVVQHKSKTTDQELSLQLFIDELKKELKDKESQGLCVTHFD